MRCDIGLRTLLFLSTVLGFPKDFDTARASALSRPCKNLVSASMRLDAKGVYKAVTGGCSVNSRLFSNSQTILHRAAIMKNPVWVDFLLNLGADPTLSDASGKAPPEYAQGLAELAFTDRQRAASLPYEQQDLGLLTKLGKRRALTLLSEKDLHSILMRSPFGQKSYFGLGRESARRLALHYGEGDLDFLDLCLDWPNTSAEEAVSVKAIINSLNLPAGATCVYAYVKLMGATSLQLSGRGIVSLKALKYAENIEILNLAENVLVALDGVETLKNLKNLDLSSNKIENIRRLAYLKKLQDVNLSHNRIRHAQPIVAIPGLRNVNLSGNFIGDTSFLKALPENCRSIPEHDPVQHLEEKKNYILYHNKMKSAKVEEEKKFMKEFNRFNSTLSKDAIEPIYSSQVSQNLLNFRKSMLDEFLLEKIRSSEVNIENLERFPLIGIGADSLYSAEDYPYMMGVGRESERIEQLRNEIVFLENAREQGRRIRDHEAFEKHPFYQKDTMNIDRVGEEYFRLHMSKHPLPIQNKNNRVVTIFIHGTKSRVLDALPSEKYPFGNSVSALSQNVLGIKNLDFIIADGITSHSVNDHDERYCPHGQSGFVPEATGFGLEEVGKHALGVMKGLSSFQKHSDELDFYWSLLLHGKIQGIGVVNIIGWSRGAIAAIKLANMMHEDLTFRDVKVNIFAIDPVPGGFDSMHFDDKKFILNQNVKNFIGVYGEDEYSVFLTRLKPLIASPEDTKTKYLRIPGMHSTVAGSVTNKNNVTDVHYNFLSTGLIVRDLAEKFLSQHGSRLINKLNFTDLEIVRHYENIHWNQKGYEELRNYSYFWLRTKKKKLLLSQNHRVDLSQEFPSYLLYNYVNSHHHELCDLLKLKWGRDFDDLLNNL